MQLFCIKREILNQEACTLLEDLFNQHLDEGITKAKSVKGEEQMPTVSVQIVKCICNFLEYLFTSHKQAVPIHEKKEVWSKKINFYFGFAYIWGFGAAYKPNALRFVDNMLRDFFGKLHIPMAETVFEYFFNEKE